MTTPWAHPQICLVSPLYPPATGGVERYVERLASGLRDRGIPVEIATTDPGARAASVERLHGVVVRRFPTIGGDALFYPSPHLLRWLTRHADRYALLHAHNLHTLLPMAAAWASRATRTPLVLTPHWHGTGHTPIRRLLHVPYRPAAGLVVRGADAIIGNSQGEATLLRRDFGDQLPITVIPEGIELSREVTTGAPARPVGANAARISTGVPLADDSFRGVTILSVGRLEPYKGVDRIVHALVSLPPYTRLVVVGQGPATDAIRRAAVDSGVADRVLLRGRVPDDELAAWYQHADVFVSLSTHESFGLTVLEAAAAGLPVVASDIPAHREARAFVPDRRVTLTAIDAGPQAIGAAISAALGQGRAADRSGWPLPSWEALVDETIDTYRQVLVSRQARR